MRLELTDEQESLRTTIRRCLETEAPVDPYVRGFAGGRKWERDAVWDQLVHLGATALLVPTDHGGLGLGLAEAVVVSEEMGRSLYPGPWLAASVPAVRALEAVESVGAATRLEATAAGTSIRVLAAPPVGRSRCGVSVVAGRLTGGIDAVAGAPLADELLVVAGPDDRGILYAVATDSPECRVEDRFPIDGTISVGAVNLVGAAAEAVGPITKEAADAARDSALVVACADSVGAAQAVMETAIAYAKDRHQFGQPIGAFQAVQHLCVDMYERVELARSGVIHAAWAADQADGTLARRTAHQVKSYADRLTEVADMAIQVLGGIGFTWEHDAHLYLKRLMTLSTYLGRATDARTALGRQVVAEILAEPSPQ